MLWLSFLLQLISASFFQPPLALLHSSELLLLRKEVTLYITNPTSETIPLLVIYKLLYSQDR